MKILVMGGTRFVGKSLVEKLLNQNHEIDIFTRGNRPNLKGTNLIKGDVIKNSLKVQDGPLLGKLIRYLSIELAYKRLENFDEAIYKAKKWIKQNAPKCD